MEIAKGLRYNKFHPSRSEDNALTESYPQIFQVSFEATPFGPSVISWLFVNFRSFGHTVFFSAILLIGLRHNVVVISTSRMYRGIDEVNALIHREPLVIIFQVN